MDRERVLQIIPSNGWFALFKPDDQPRYSGQVEAFVLVEITDEATGKTWQELRALVDGLSGFLFAYRCSDYLGIQHGRPDEEAELM